MERIEIKYKGLDSAEHSAYITPLARKEGILVLHKLIEAFGALESGHIADALKTLDGDTFWDLACRLLRMSTIDLKECKDLNDSDLFNGKYSDLYALVFAALKANYPDFFALMLGSGLIERIALKTEAGK